MAEGTRGVVATSIGVGLATGLYGVSFGALGVASGLDLWQTQLLSLLMFSGASQFAFVGMIASGGTAAAGVAIMSAWLLGVRNGFYAIRLKPLLETAGLKRLVAAQLTIDESTAVATAEEAIEARHPDEARRLSRLGFWLTGAAVFVFWNLMTFAGALLGSAFSDPGSLGLDAAVAAAFLALLWPRLRERQSLTVALLAIAVATILTPVLPLGLPILCAGAVAVVFGLGNWLPNRAEGTS